VVIVGAACRSGLAVLQALTRCLVRRVGRNRAAVGSAVLA
jgi:hypothetical protein